MNEIKRIRTRRVTRRSRPVRVADAIKDWVVEQRLQKGDRLPGENEMIARFGMSKGTIREAMRVLEAQGLIETRTGPGGGSFVAEVSEERARSLLGNYFYFKNLTIADIYQLRRALEPELVASLAGILDEEALTELDGLTEPYRLPAETEEEERDQHIASLRFHARLADHADNALLGFLIGFMARILTDMTVERRLYAPPNRQLWQQGLDHQRAVVAALRQGDGAMARDIMREHMEQAQALMEDQEAKVVNRFFA